MGSRTIDLLEGDILFGGDKETGIVLGTDYFGIKEEDMAKKIFIISEIYYHKFNKENFANGVTDFGGYAVVFNEYDGGARR